jgi:integrase
MNAGGDKLATTQEADLLSVCGSGKSGKLAKHGKSKPAAHVKFGSAVVPVYRSASGNRTRFTISFHRDGKRLRQTFPTLDAAKKEAQLVAQRIQAGMQHVTDMKPHDRDAFVTAKQMLESLGIPLVAAVEDYVRSRKIAGTESLSAMATDYSQHFGKVTRRATVPEVVDHLLKSKAQDGASDRHLAQLRSVLRRFAAAHPVPILDVSSPDIDTWLRGFNVSLTSRNSMLVYVKLLFSFALTHNYLPEGRATAAESLKKVKAQGGDVEIYTPGQFRKILHAAPPHLVPLLAIGGFSGIRMAELARLDWNAVDLERRHIEVRAGQAKTSSRRLIPISDNLIEWLTPLPRTGRVIASCQFNKEVSALARALKIGWPHNVLRHSFISYRIAKVKSADQVALEAGNSPSIIFKHYRELTTEEQADKWFDILPKEGQWENTCVYDYKTRMVTLPEDTGP